MAHSRLGRAAVEDVKRRRELLYGLTRVPSFTEMRRFWPWMPPSTDCRDTCYEALKVCRVTMQQSQRGAAIARRKVCLAKSHAAIVSRERDCKKAICMETARW